MMKEEVKTIILEAGFQGENVDDLVNTCF